MSKSRLFQAWLDRFIPPIEEGTEIEMKALPEVQITPSTPIPTKDGGEIFMPEKHVKLSDVNKKKKAELATAYFAMKTWVEELWAVELALDGTPAPKEAKFYTQAEFRELNIPPRMRGAYGKVSELYFTTYGRVIEKAKAIIAAQGKVVQADAEPVSVTDVTTAEPAPVEAAATTPEPEIAAMPADSNEDDELGSTVVTEENGVAAVASTEEVELTTSEPTDTETEPEEMEDIMPTAVLQQQAEPLEVAPQQNDSHESPLEWTRTSETNKDRAFIGAAVAKSASNRPILQVESDEPEGSEWSTEVPNEGFTTPAVPQFDFELLFGNGVVNMVAAMLASMSNFDNGLEGIILKVLDGVDATRDAAVTMPEIALGGSKARVHIHRTNKLGTFVISASDGDKRLRFTLAVEDATQPEAEDIAD